MRRDSGFSTLRGILTASSAMLALGASLWFATQAQAQETSIIHPGSMAVTGFSGTVIPRIEEGLPPGVDPVDETFIDTGRATLRVFDVSALGGPPTGQLVYTPPPFEVLASQIGQVFALTYDDGVRDDGSSGVPNLYAGATSLHGLSIVTPDEDADGRPERQRRGKAGATFMDGQFADEQWRQPGRDLEDRRRQRRRLAVSRRSTPTADPASATSASTRQAASSSPPTSTPA